MGQIDVWHGLEREVRAQGSRVLFERAREHQPSLQPYVDLSAAAAAAAACRCEHRDAIVAAFLREHRDRPAPLWTAAAVLAMRLPLMSLVRILKNARGEENDAKSIVLTSFLEAVNNVAACERISFQLFSETRRLIFHVGRLSVEDHARRSRKDVAVCVDEDDASIEARLDGVRLLRRAAAAVPHSGERPAAYVERLAPSHTPVERDHRDALLRDQRFASLAEFREAFRSICQPQTDGETR